MAGAHGDGPIVGINVTPLVDVVLVLLVVLMVSASAIAAKQVPVDLPEARSAEPGQTPTTLVVTIDARGGVALDAVAVQATELAARARAAKAADPRTRVVLAADGASTHAATVRVLDTLRMAGITQFAFAADVVPEAHDTVAPPRGVGSP